MTNEENAKIEQAVRAVAPKRCDKGFIAKEISEHLRVEMNEPSITHQAVTAFLRKGLETGLLTNKKNGRHRYFLAKKEVTSEPVSPPPSPPKEKPMKKGQQNGRSDGLRGGLETGSFKDLLPQKDTGEGPEARRPRSSQATNPRPSHSEKQFRGRGRPKYEFWGFSIWDPTRLSPDEVDALSTKCALAFNRLITFEPNLELTEAALQPFRKEEVSSGLFKSAFPDRNVLLEVALALVKTTAETDAKLIERPQAADLLDMLFLSNFTLDQGLIEKAKLSEEDRAALDSLVTDLGQYKRWGESEKKLNRVRDLSFGQFQRIFTAVHELTDTVDKAHEHGREVTVRLQKANRRTEELDTRINQLEAAKTKVSQQRQQAVKQVEQLQHELETEKREKEVATAAKTNLERQLEILKQELATARQQLTEQLSPNGEVEELKWELKEVQEARAAIVKQFEEGSSAWKQEKANFEGEIKQLTSDLEALQKERESAQAEPTDWQKEKDRLQRENFRLTEDLEVQKQSTASRQKDISRLLTANNELRDQLEAAQKAAASAAPTDVVATGDVLLLRNALTGKDNLLASAKESIRQQKERIAQLERERDAARAAAGDTSSEGISCVDHEAALEAARRDAVKDMVPAAEHQTVQTQLTQTRERLAELEKQPGACQMPANLGQHITDHLTQELTHLREQVTKLMTDNRGRESRHAANGSEPTTSRTIDKSTNWTEFFDQFKKGESA